VVKDPEPSKEQELAEALHSCIAALSKIDRANGALTEGRGNLLYDNPDPLAREMNIATAHGQRTYLRAMGVLQRFEQERS
jgi:hypothetical protein